MQACAAEAALCLVVAADPAAQLLCSDLLCKLALYQHTVAVHAAKLATDLQKKATGSKTAGLRKQTEFAIRPAVRSDNGILTLSVCVKEGLLKQHREIKCFALQAIHLLGLAEPAWQHLARSDWL